MKYYIIIGDSFIGIGSSLNFKRYQAKHDIVLCCDEKLGEYLEYNDVLYHDNWLVPCKTDLVKYTTANIIEISQKEYDQLYKAIQKNEEIEIEEKQEEEYEIPQTHEEIVTVESAKEMKINEMNYVCRHVIEAGFDIVLLDNQNHHFSLTTQDQLNLITLSSMVANGLEQVPYHADGELCQYYQAADIQNVVNVATAFKTYHTTYVNALKMYIRSLDSIDEILSIEYGISLPEEYQSDVLKALLNDNQ